MQHIPLLMVSAHVNPVSQLLTPRGCVLCGGLLAYGIVIYAMSGAPMGAVSALRETSVLFAAVIGYVFLGESRSIRKIMACTMIVTGTILIG
ncbi:DMT family transporter [Pectobacterium betavasculorum]|uniref:EamA family transporter n=1 Tax=Pectobacterium betavasculorum TaxID=55207 RepID=UPI001E64F21C|nr:EamA family transporter [Pectobacterium betavasculorum]